MKTNNLAYNPISFIDKVTIRSNTVLNGKEKTKKYKIKSKKH